jgi:ATP-dependent DNA helicase RecG
MCHLRDQTGQISLRFLNFYPSQVTQLKEGAYLRVYGEVRSGFFGWEMVHPQYRKVAPGTPILQSLTPVYPTTAGLSQATLRKWIDWSLTQDGAGELLPATIYRQLALPSLAKTLQHLHHPPPQSDIHQLQDRTHATWRRLAFDELLAQQFSMRKHHARRRSMAAPALPPSRKLVTALLQQLKFALTVAQQRAAMEISQDLMQPHPMQRLLQGDVGSGKTVVATMAALQAIEHGWQAAMMAPTEILAEQHYKKLQAWLLPLGIEVAWVSGSQTKKQREEALSRVAGGHAMLAIGTHALFQDEVVFSRLGLSIIDEQHRFGVHQRLALRQKGMTGLAEPHQLMMSATPIPRTLSMSYYADLDVSVIDELPPGRTPVTTRLVANDRREEVLERVREACQTGRQAYWVCPLIEESEALQLKTAMDTYAQLQESFPNLRVGLVHGRMKPTEKQAVMAAFSAGETQLLVATTVIEVGVDVPNASLMVIEHAERMGLSQLHQLRGRVGRGAAKSSCILLYEHRKLSQTAKARLKIIYESTDGFEIAKADLALRGPGEFMGVRQSGVPMLRIADLERDADLLAQANALADGLLVSCPEAVEQHIARWMGQVEELVKV